MSTINSIINTAVSRKLQPTNSLGAAPEELAQAAHQLRAARALRRQRRDGVQDGGSLPPSE